MTYESRHNSPPLSSPSPPPPPPPTAQGINLVLLLSLTPISSDSETSPRPLIFRTMTESCWPVCASL